MFRETVVCVTLLLVFFIIPLFNFLRPSIEIVEEEKYYIIYLWHNYWEGSEFICKKRKKLFKIRRFKKK